MKKVLKVNDLKSYYKTILSEKVYAVDGVSLELEAGKVLGIAGESGCGKSTLALSLMGYYMPPLYFNGGEISILETKITDLDKEKVRSKILGKEIAYIPQAAMNTLNPTLRIKNFLFDCIREHEPNMSKEDMTQLAMSRFEALGLDQRVLNAYPNELSGGMKQRTVIAISTILNPKVLIADEPTSALDVTSQKKVIKLLKKLLDEKYVQSMVFITHELPLLYHVADEIMIMYAGQIVEKGSKNNLVFDPLHPYSKELMGSIVVPELGMKDHKLSAIPGTPPSLKVKHVGCRFHQRCKYAVDACKEDTLELKVVGDRYYRCIR